MTLLPRSLLRGRASRPEPEDRGLAGEGSDARLLDQGHSLDKTKLTDLVSLARTGHHQYWMNMGGSSSGSGSSGSGDIYSTFASTPRRPSQLRLSGLLLLLPLLSLFLTPSLGLAVDVTAHRLLTECKRSQLEALLSKTLPWLEGNAAVLISLFRYQAFPFKHYYRIPNDGLLIEIINWLQVQEAPSNIISLLLPLAHFQGRTRRLALLLQGILPQWPLYPLATSQLQLTLWDSSSIRNLFLHLRLRQRTRIQSVVFCEQLLRESQLVEYLGTNLFWPLVDLACMRRAQGGAWQINQLLQWARKMVHQVGLNELLYWRVHILTHLYYDTIDGEGEGEGGGDQERVSPKARLLSLFSGMEVSLPARPLQPHIDTFFDPSKSD